MGSLKDALVRAAEKDQNLAAMVRKKVVEESVSKKLFKLEKRLEASGTEGLDGFVPCSSLKFKPGSRYVVSGKLPCYVKWSLTDQEEELVIICYESPVIVNDSAWKRWDILTGQQLEEDTSRRGKK